MVGGGNRKVFRGNKQPPTWRLDGISVASGIDQESDFLPRRSDFNIHAHTRHCL